MKRCAALHQSLRTFWNISHAPQKILCQSTVLNCQFRYQYSTHIPASGDIGKQAITEPLKHPDFFKVRQLVSVKDLYNNRVHFGHKDGSRNEHMQPYLFGNRLGTDIFDLDITIDHLHRALNFVAHIAYMKGIILFIMKSQQFGHAVETTAMTCGEYAHTRDWHPGLLLNMSEQGGQIRLPDICIFLSLQDAVNQQHLAVAECGKLKIATVGICDSNVNPTMITYPVPGYFNKRYKSGSKSDWNMTGSYNLKALLLFK